MPSFSKAREETISAASYVLMEAGSRKILYGKNAHERRPMASTTKIMTALLALETGELSELVEVSKEAYGVEGSSIYLKLGEKISLKDLLYGLMLSSGNDAAVAIAIHIGKSVEGFAAMMNEKAQSLGMNNSHFVTPNGLHHEEHYTSAYDLALLCAAAMENASFRQIVSTRYYKTETGDTSRTFRNKNRILTEYAGGNGIKTGYTKKAGRCLAFSAEREGMLLIGTVLNAPDMFEDAKKLLDQGFANFEMQKVVGRLAPIAHIPLQKSKKNVLDLLAKEAIIIPIETGVQTELSTRVEIVPSLSAPLTEGEVCGRLLILEGDRILAQTELIAAESAKALDFGSYLGILYLRWVG